MPELPEVETVVRGLRAPLVGRGVTGVWTENTRFLRVPSLAAFADRLSGQRFLAVTRRAKYIVCQMSSDVLAVHLKMTGRLYVAAEPPPEERWLRLRLALDDGQTLFFSDARRFGRVFLGSTLDEITPDLGPEPLEDSFTVDVFHERLRGRSMKIKALLLDQSFIAGVGNIYADEALYLAQIHPRRPADSLDTEEVTALHAAVRSVLFAAVDHEGASVNWYRKPDGSLGESQNHFCVYDREGQPCPRCGAAIAKIRVVQRGTHYCPACQPER